MIADSWQTTLSMASIMQVVGRNSNQVHHSNTMCVVPFIPRWLLVISPWVPRGRFGCELVNPSSNMAVELEVPCRKLRFALLPSQGWGSQVITSPFFSWVPGSPIEALSVALRCMSLLLGRQKLWVGSPRICFGDRYLPKLEAVCLKKWSFNQSPREWDTHCMDNPLFSCFLTEVLESEQQSYSNGRIPSNK